LSWDPEKLRSLFDLLIEKDIAEFEHEDEGARVRIVRGKIAVATPHVAAAAPIPVAHAHAAPAGSAPADSDVYEVTSPFVGTFYRSPSPESDPFVAVNGTVKKGQTLCIIEAMKLMNEIEAEFAGTVLEVLVDSGKSVEFGQKLFKIKKS